MWAFYLIRPPGSSAPGSFRGRAWDALLQLGLAEDIQIPEPDRQRHVGRGDAHDPESDRLRHLQLDWLVGRPVDPIRAGGVEDPVPAPLQAQVSVLVRDLDLVLRDGHAP